MRVANYQTISLLNQTSCEGAAYHVCNGVQSRNPLHLCVGYTGSAENGGSENGHTSNTDPLLHDLKPDDQLNTTPSVKLARADTEKHGNI